MDQIGTIRDYLRRRDRLIRHALIAVCVWVLVMIVLVVWDRDQSYKYLRTDALTVFVIFLAAFVYLIISTKCPRCGFNLRPRPGTRQLLKASKNACPRCGLSFDAPMAQDDLPPGANPGDK